MQTLRKWSWVVGLTSALLTLGAFAYGEQWKVLAISVALVVAVLFGIWLVDYSLIDAQNKMHAHMVCTRCGFKAFAGPASTGCPRCREPRA